MRKIFRSETTVFSFEDVQAIGPITLRGSNKEPATLIRFKDMNQFIFSSSKAEAQRLADEFYTYLQEKQDTEVDGALKPNE